MSGHGRIWWLSRYVLMGVLLGGSIVAVLRGLAYAEEPVASGSVLLSAVEQAARTTPTPISSAVSGQYIQMEYASVFDTLAHGTSDTRILESYTMGSRNAPSRTMVVSVQTTTSADLREDSSYRVRADAPTQYKLTPVVVRGERAVVSRRVDGHEEVLFWLHGQRLLIVALTTAEPGDVLDTLMAPVLGSVRWVQ